MRVLHLTLKKKWFDLIASGEKKEEYREIKEYWIKRLISDDFNWDCATTDKRNAHYVSCPNGFYKHYDEVIFKNGYSKNAPQIRMKVQKIFRGEGFEDWGAEPGKPYFVIKLGEIIK